MRATLAGLIVLSLVVAAPVAAQTQITTGVIRGAVSDSTGAVLPGVNVDAVNADTGLTQRGTTDDEGRFVFLQLPPGRYTVTFRLAGFGTVVQENIDLTVGQSINLTPRLSVSNLAETVTVTGTTVVEAGLSAVATTLNQTTVETTPILGRKFEDLLTLTPGVSVVQGPDGDEITFAGQRGVFNNISLDGGDFNNGFFGEQVGGQRAPIDVTLDAVKEFQVIASGAPAEFGRTAGGVVNVITKSGTNDLRGTAFYFQRLEGLTGDLSDGTQLTDFHREQFGGTLGGPIKPNTAFFFGAAEGITGNFERANLSRAIGTPCPVAAPTVAANQALIDGSPDCQRLALLNLFQTTLGQDEAQPIRHPIKTAAVMLKSDWNLSPANRLAVSYNFNRSRKENETFDVATYGSSANGTEGDPARINLLNSNFFSTLANNKLNEFHFTYSRENRPRTANPSNIHADTGVGFAPSFRFGNPYFLQPNVDELIWRAQLKDNLSIVWGRHTVKMGGEWMHTLNDQIFRGFFTGRYLFGSVTGFLRYASPAAPGGFGPGTVACSNGAFVTLPASCPAGTVSTGSPLLFYQQAAAPSGAATDAAGASTITNDEFSLFVQDQWQIRNTVTVQYGLRWDSQRMPDTVDPQTTVFAPFLNDPRFPSDGTIPSQWAMFQPRVGATWDVRGNGRSVLRTSAGIYFARQNMLSQVGSVTANGIQQYTIAGVTPTWPGVVNPAPLPPGQFAPFSGIRVFDREYANPRTYTFNVGYEHELIPNMSAYADYTYARGRHLTRFFNYNRATPVCCDMGPGTGDVYSYLGSPFSPQLNEVMVTTSLGKSEYNGLTLGVRKRFSQRYQLEANYVLSRDKDDDSNERDPFRDRSFNFFDHSLDYALSDRDIRHKFNFFGYFEVPWALMLNTRVQARGAQPITASPRALNGVDRGRNGERKDNEYFSFDWRLSRPIRLANGTEIIPTIEMFNTFNNANNINPLSTPALFNFDGFLRTGVGDPRQVQLAVKVAF
jgi:Carboxypeptidase regulatory-like domain/TonB dependent receptor-like, beta-barrel